MLDCGSFSHVNVADEKVKGRPCLKGTLRVGVLEVVSVAQVMCVKAFSVVCVLT